MSDFLAITIEFASVPHGTDEQFEEFLDNVHAELEKIGRDVSLSARLAQRVATFAIESDTDGDTDSTEARLLVDLRTALHAADCGTANWPTFVPRSQRVEELQPA